MILLIGPSASGKTEIAKLLETKYKLKKVITTTTRPIRAGEKNDVDYHFCDKEKFLKKIESNDFVEYTLYNGNYYGTTKDELSNDKVVILDPSGIKSFLKLDNPSFVSFYLNASIETRIKRMKIRGDNELDIISRINNDKESFAKEKLPTTDYSLVTDDESIENLTEKVKNLYFETLKKRGIA